MASNKKQLTLEDIFNRGERKDDCGFVQIVDLDNKYVFPPDQEERILKKSKKNHKGAATDVNYRSKTIQKYLSLMKLNLGIVHKILKNEKKGAVWCTNEFLRNVLEPKKMAGMGETDKQCAIIAWEIMPLAWRKEENG